MRVETKLVILAPLLLIVTCFFWLGVAQAAAVPGTKPSLQGDSHPAKPTISPTVLNHKHLSWGSCRCLMCLGQHLRNYHGEPNDRLDAVGYRNWIRYHKKLHATGVYKAPKPRPGCAGGVCPAPRPRFYRLFRRWRR